MKVSVGLSNRHLHVSREDLDVLFGKDYELNHLKDLSQPGQYAAQEVVDLVGPKGVLKNVRILGPVRNSTQIEVSFADARALGVSAPVRESGKIQGTPGCKLVGPQGEVEISEGVIVAARHIHMHSDDAVKFGVYDKELVNVETDGARGIVFKNVLVRADDSFALELHLDIEEGNAAGLKNGDEVTIVKIEESK